MDKSDWSNLIFSTYKGKYGKMKRILEKQDNANFVTKNGLTATIVAIRKQDYIALDILLNSGKIIKDSCEDLVMLASFHDNAEILKLLIAHGYPIIVKENNYTPLMAACSFGSMEVMEVLIQHGVNVNTQREIDGITSLMYSVMNGDINKIKMLLSNGADVNISDSKGNKAIDYLSYIPDHANENDSIKNEIEKLLK